MFLAPAPEGRRRLRSSQSLHSMFSVQENNKLNLCHSISTTPLIEDQRLSPEQSSPAGPSLPLAADRESSFEDLEQFLVTPEEWPATAPLREPPTGAKGSQQENLKGVVKDIHNAIGEEEATGWVWFGKEGVGLSVSCP